MKMNEASETANEIMQNGMNLTNSDIICDAVCHWFIGENDCPTERDFELICKMIAAKNGQIVINKQDVAKYYAAVVEETAGAISWD